MGGAERSGFTPAAGEEIGRVGGLPLDPEMIDRVLGQERG